MFNAVKHFYDMNDVIINRKKIGMYIGEYVKKQKDKAYTAEQVQKILEFCDERLKALILLLTSTGMRIGAIPDLKLSQIQKIKEYDLYRISVYEGTKDEYYCFTTPEAAKAIDTYLEYRQRSREKLTDVSPLFREQMLVDYTLKTV
jgi:integrase